MLQERENNNRYNGLLGTPLSQREVQLCRAIYLAGYKGITAIDLANNDFINGKTIKNRRNSIWIMIQRLRDKLGAEEIISIPTEYDFENPNKGGYYRYTSRRALIDHMVEENQRNLSVTFIENRKVPAEKV